MEHFFFLHMQLWTQHEMFANLSKLCVILKHSTLHEDNQNTKFTKYCHHLTGYRPRHDAILPILIRFTTSWSSFFATVFHAIIRWIKLQNYFVDKINLIKGKLHTSLWKKKSGIGNNLSSQKKMIYLRNIRCSRERYVHLCWPTNQMLTNLWQ